MNDPGTSDPSPDDAVRAAIDDAAASVQIGAPDEHLSGVRERASGRRRRRNAVVGVAAALTLIAGGVVVATVVGNDSDGDDLIVSAPADESEREVDESADEPGDASTSDAGTEGEPGAESVPVEPEPTEPIEPAEPADDVAAEPVATEVVGEAETIVSIDPDVNAYQQVLPWKDGFLSIGQIHVPQALPTELPEEISSQFPDEVVQFFDDAGGLPATIEEATAMLQEAGLLQVVADVISANPEVSDAIYSTPPEPAVPFARISDDGREWNDIELDVPVDAQFDRRIVSTGDRLVLVATEAADFVEPEPAADGTFPERYRPPAATAINVLSTTDLVTWTQQRVELPPVGGVEVDYLWTSTYLGGVAANDDGWVVSLGSFVEVDYVSLLPDDVDVAALESQYGYGIYHDDNGIILESYDEQGVVDETVLTWAELGLEGKPAGLDQADRGPSESMSTWTAGWSDTPVETTAASFGEVAAFQGGFIRQGQGIEYSADGIVWTALEQPIPSAWSNSFLALPGGGVVALAGGFDLQGAFALDVDTLTWSELDIPDLPEGFSPWGQPSGNAVLYSVEDFGADEPVVNSIVNDSFELRFTIGRTTQSYELIDLATGEVVGGEIVYQFDAEGDLLQEEPDGGLTVLSAETGEPITTFSMDDIEASQPDSAEDAAQADDVVVLDQPPAQPDVYVVATDGEAWINQRIEVDESQSPSDFAFVNEATANNGVVLVSLSDGSLIRIEI